ncbi:hypothetical protein PI125_g24372 [Phytophthora idaei]|nr:hypothetical protein PI125_g24372 [Phytophthora idaei]KAG3124922.1 hypothetical protein PI126_g23014 [Phytophthora idaei]
MAESLYHTRVNDIHELEEIIEDVLKGKERMAKRDGVARPEIPDATSPTTVTADVTDVSQTVPVTTTAIHREWRSLMPRWTTY